MKVKNDDIEKKNIEKEIQLEKIAKIVEDNIHFVDEDMPVYDGYDVPEIEEDVHIKEGVYINEGNRKDISPKQKKESKNEKKVERIQVLSRGKRARERRKLSQVGKLVLLSRLLLIG